MDWPNPGIVPPSVFCLNLERNKLNKSEKRRKSLSWWSLLSKCWKYLEEPQIRLPFLLHYLFVIVSEMSELCEVLITSSHHQVTLLHWSATEWDVHGGGWPPGQYVDTVVMTGSRMTREKADILTLPLKMIHESQQSEIHQNPDLRYNSISDLRISWLRGLK